MSDETPGRRWELSAPESGVLLWGPETRAGEALKLALLELIVRQTLRLVAVKDRRLFVFSKRVNLLAPGTSRDQPSGRALRAVLDVAPPSRAYPDGIFGAPVEQWARAVVARYRRRGGYVQAEVLPALEARGLYRQERYRRLGLFEGSRWTLTPAGTAALVELKGLVESGRAAFGQGMEPDPARVRAILATAGAAVLLLPGLFPEIRYFQPREEGSGFEGTVVVFTGSGGSGEERRPDGDDRSDEPEPGEPDADVFSLDALAGIFGPGPFDGLDAASDAIDAGVDAGGGDGGGDGDGE
jgi:hypothetical protein